MRVIAPLRGLFTQTLESVIAWLTQSAGHVLPEHTTLGGNSTSAEHTSHQPQPASTVRSQKSEPVQQTTVARKRGSANKTAQQQQDQQSIQAGSKSQTLAPQTRQRASQAVKAGKKPVKRATRGKSHK
jgi:hypothetical protein